MVPSAPKVEPSIFIQQFRHHKNQLRSNPGTRHVSPATFTQKDLQIPRTSSCGKTQHASLWNLHTVAHTKRLPARTRHLNYQKTESNPLTYWKKINMTTATHQTNLAAFQQYQMQHQHFIVGTHAPGALYAYLSVSLHKDDGVMWGYPHNIT